MSNSPRSNLSDNKIELCRICQAPSAKVGDKLGKYIKRSFALFHCNACGFYFVQNPETDTDKIYNVDYYTGRGADGSFNHIQEMQNYDRTVRNYEWQGIVTTVKHLFGNLEGVRWLDYGCGAGGLVSYCQKKLGIEAAGFDHGWITDQARAAGVNILDTEGLDGCQQQFDVITAIEVLEHCLDPLAELRSIRRLLKPGGMFFYTTSNSTAFEKDILNWSYYVPEIHISLFQPRTMTYCLNHCGFEIESCGFLPGYESIIRYKVLKSLGVSNMNQLERLMPWNVMARVIDRRYGLSQFPIAWG